MRQIALLGLVVGLLHGNVIGPIFADEYPQFRGFQGRGIVTEQLIPTNWSKDKGIAWKIAVPGAGWSQPIVWNDKLFVTAAVSDIEMKPKEFAASVRMPQSMGMGGLTPAPKTNIEWKLFCYDSSTGSKLWDSTITAGQPQYSVHPSNTYATETPAVDANGIYSFFGATGTVAANDFQGKTIWTKELGAYPTNNSFGTGSSVAFHDGVVIVQHLTEKSATIHGLDSRTGKSLWTHERAAKGTSWSSPFVWQNDIRTEVICSGGTLVESIDPKSGAVFWSVANVKAPTACSIASDSSRIYFGGSDPMSKGPLFAVRFGANGALKPDKMNDKFDFCDWLTPKSAPGMSSPVSNGSHVFVVDNNILRIYSTSSGEKVAERRLGKLKQIVASPIIIGDKILMVDETGESLLLGADETAAELGGGTVEDLVWSTPAVANSSIFIRGVDALYCIRN